MLERRKFVKLGLAAAVVPTIVPRHVLGGQGYTAPSGRITLGGVGIGGSRCEEDFLRAAFAMVRHYAVEGRTDDFAAAQGWKLFPGHLANGDFAKGLEGWTASGEVTNLDVVAKLDAAELVAEPPADDGRRIALLPDRAAHLARMIDLEEEIRLAASTSAFVMVSHLQTISP